MISATGDGKGGESPTVVGVLSLERVVDISRERNPTFAEFAANREAARAEILNALAYPNPEVEGRFGGAKGREAPSQSRAIFEVNVAQPLESPLKRRTRRAAAEASSKVVDKEEALFQVDLRAETSNAYYNVLFFERAIKLAKDSRRIADDIEGVVNRRVESGEAPEIDRIKARVEVLKASRAVQAQVRSLTTARAALNVLCGGGLPADFRLEDTLGTTLAPASEEESIRSAMEGHALLGRLGAEREKQQAVIAQEKAAWHPDLKPGISIGRDFDTDTTGISLGIEIPIWNRNRGGIAAGEAELNRIDAGIVKARLEIAGEVHIAIQDYEGAREQIAAFDAGLRGGAAESLRNEAFLYEQGETDFLQLLDARRTAQETETEYLQALFDGARALVELEHAVGAEDKGR